MAPEKNNRKTVAETGIELRLILSAAFTVMIENVKITFVTHIAV